MEGIQDLNDMVLFAQVVEHGGYTPAARALGMQTSKLSRRISELERQLGVRLLNRTTRRISVSEAGQTFHRYCLAVMAESQAAREAIDQTRSSPQGLVRLSCPLALLQSGVAAILSRYLADNPRVRIRLDATNRRVDVVEEGLDIALRVRVPPLQDSDLVIRPLGRAETLLVASPWFFANHARPTALDDLALVPTLAMSSAGDRHVWHFVTADGSAVSVQHQPRLITDDMVSLHRAALDGVGLTRLPKSLVQADLDAGRLEPVLPELGSPQGIVHAVFASRRGLVPAVRGLLDALVVGLGGGAG